MYKIDNDIPLLIKSDAKRYKQVLFNLIGNALKFTFKGSIEVHLYVKNNILYTEVRDSGIGIHCED